MATTTKHATTTKQAPKAEPPKADQRPAPGDHDVQQGKNAAVEFADWLNGKSDQLAKWCQGSTLTPDALIRFAGITFRREPKFHPREVWPSIYLALVTAAQLGLEPSGPLGEGWIVPRWDKRLRMQIAQWQTGYRGYIALLVRNGSCKRVRAFSVFEGDEFQIDQGSEPRIHHRIFTGPAEDRGEVIGAYAIAWLANGEQEYEWVPRVDIDKAREVAADGSAAWKDWYDQMARRLPIKRLANQLPVSPRMRQAIAIENADDQDAIQRVLEGSASTPDQQRALPAASPSSSWPIPAGRKDRLKESLANKRAAAAGGIARAVQEPDLVVQYGKGADEQLPDWSAEQSAPDPDQVGDGPPPDDLDARDGFGQ